MIIEFSVQNFRSIYDKVTLSMMAAKLTGKEATLDNIFYHPNYPNIPLLKSAVIYGANASGKSNVLKALKKFQEFIEKSTDYKFEQKLPYEPFRLLKNSTNEPSSFEMDFIALDGIRYIYGFKMNEEEILEEYLSSYTSRKETKLFVRKKGEKIVFSSAFKGEKKILEDQLLKNNLLLSKAANSNYEQMQTIYSYFVNQFIMNMGDIAWKGYSKRKLVNNLDLKNIITEILKLADTGINSIEVEKNESGGVFKDSPDLLKVLTEVESKLPKKMSTPNNMMYSSLLSELYSTDVIHYTSDETEPKRVIWALSQESSGTQKLFELAVPIIDVLRSGAALVFDEINNSLHPLLSRLIIELFHKNSNPKNAQLIFTTHDVSLLTSEIFRRDQIWFTEKNNEGMTDLYSLGSFDKKDVRKDIPIDKWYLSGRFGAIPIIQELNIKPE